jgi:hypothetical protein
VVISEKTNIGKQRKMKYNEKPKIIPTSPTLPLSYFIFSSLLWKIK